MCNRLITSQQPAVGVVIGTFAAVPYIHLQLEARRRFYPDVPLLISDDASPFADVLRSLCAQYGASFVSNTARKRRSVGDLSAYVHGLDWAAAQQIDLLIKFSRRFLPLFNWVPGLQRLAYESQYATYSGSCDHFNFGFRTEAIGFHVGAWGVSESLRRLRNLVSDNAPCFVEGTLHDMARNVHRHLLETYEAARAYAHSHPQLAERDGYALWDIMTARRTERAPDVLWHDCDTPMDYYRVARLLALNYHVEDFVDPNQGYGLGPN